MLRSLVQAVSLSLSSNYSLTGGAIYRRPWAASQVSYGYAGHQNRVSPTLTDASTCLPKPLISPNIDLLRVLGYFDVKSDVDIFRTSYGLPGFEQITEV